MKAGEVREGQAYAVGSSQRFAKGEYSVHIPLKIDADGTIHTAKQLTDGTWVPDKTRAEWVREPVSGDAASAAVVADAVAVAEAAAFQRGLRAAQLAPRIREILSNRGISIYASACVDRVELTYDQVLQLVGESA